MRTIDIVFDARKRFRESKEIDRAAAHLEQAKKYNLLSERYSGGGWQKLPEFWHMFWAVWHARAVAELLKPEQLNYDQLDEVTMILTKVPGWLGGDVLLAEEMVRNALNSSILLWPLESGSPARALMLTALARVEWKLGRYGNARKCIEEAYKEAPTADSVSLVEARRQLMRVNSRIGFFYFLHGDEMQKLEAEHIIEEAFELARCISFHQVNALRREAQRVGYHLVW